jgi:putative acetyltransferase
MSDAFARPVTIRPEQPGDAPSVRAVLEAAFGAADEAELVERLHADDELILALVAERSDGIVGYAAFPRLTIEEGARTIPAAGLAPLAVHPAAQRRRIGSGLIAAGLPLLAEQGETLVFVLGDTAYYGRFGFDAAAAAAFISPYSGPHFMLHRLAAEAPLRGHVRYPRAFDRLTSGPDP